ncbi:MAG: ABC transporter ATP-binding protein, partial [Candidatus Bathyarchaeia archaeon]
MLNTFDKKKLMIATALSTDPDLLLLDEPLGGLQAPEVAETLDLVQKIKGTGVTVMIIEHNMRAVMTLADNVLVIHHGEKIAEGPPEMVAKDPQVVSVYLGEEYI